MEACSSAHHWARELMQRKRCFARIFIGGV
jgi:hypothetical protein